VHDRQLPRRVRHGHRHERKPRDGQHRAGHGLRLPGPRRLGQLIARIAWNPATKVLTILGTIFIDGSIEFSNSSVVTYEGRATIYASGSITLRNSSKVCGVAACDATWDPLTNLLAFVAGTSSASTGFSVENFSTFQGGVYVVNDYVEQNNSTVWGPIIARQLYLQNSTINHYVPLGVLMPGMPQSWEEAVSLVNESEGWSY
jgi:hypothetical protein